jgi:hypothetical protein
VVPVAHFHARNKDADGQPIDVETDTSVEVGVSEDRVGNLRRALADLLDQEFVPTRGHLTALLGTCLFAPSLFTFWFVNGVIDFSTAFLIGGVATPAGLAVRLLAYVLLVPTFLALRAAYHLARPSHRRAVLSGSCPPTQFLSLDWFSVGILATGLPLALQDLGPWLGMNLVFLLGVFVVSRPLPERAAQRVTLAAIAFGVGLFVYARYGAVLAGITPVPDPAAVLGPVATLRVSDAVTARLFEAFNSVLVGPFLVAAVGVTMNRLLTRPELTGLPLIRHTLPRRDPAGVVVPSAALGTLFYLAVVFLATGRVVVLP